MGMSITTFLPIVGLLKVWALLSPETNGTGESADFASPKNIIFFMGLNISFIIGSWLTLRWIDKRPYTLLGMDFNLGAVKDFTRGFMVGLLNFGIIFVVLELAGLIEIELSVVHSSLFTGMITYFIVFTVAAVFEELLDRGYIFRALIEGTRPWIAISIVALAFVIGHASINMIKDRTVEKKSTLCYDLI
jgi:membrane protease YdiL (CAAX protease family)